MLLLARLNAIALLHVTEAAHALGQAGQVDRDRQALCRELTGDPTHLALEGRDCRPLGRSEIRDHHAEGNGPGPADAAVDRTPAEAGFVLAMAGRVRCSVARLLGCRLGRDSGGRRRETVI